MINTKARRDISIVLWTNLNNLYAVFKRLDVSPKLLFFPAQYLKLRTSVAKKHKSYFSFGTPTV
jgi:hypothetical protein